MFHISNGGEIFNIAMYKIINIDKNNLFDAVIIYVYK